MRDTDEALTAAEFEDEKEAQFAVLQLLEETQALEEMMGRSSESRLMQAMKLEASGNDLAKKVEGILTNGGGSRIRPGKGMLLPTAKVEGVAVLSLDINADSAPSNTLEASVLSRLQKEFEAHGGQIPRTVNVNQISEVADYEVWAIPCEEPSESLRTSIRTLGEALQNFPQSKPRRLFLVSRAEKNKEQKPVFDLQNLFGGFGLPGNSGPSWADIEKDFTTAAASSGSKSIIVRTGPYSDSSQQPVQAFSPSPNDPSTSAPTSRTVVAEALMQAITLSVDSDFSICGEGNLDPVGWAKLLLPFSGPEVLRFDVRSAVRAGLFVQNWAEEIFKPGRPGALQKIGVDTPVEAQPSRTGVVLKFRPSSTPKDTSFEKLQDGGLEFIAEEPTEGLQMLRAIRCAYRPGAAIRKKSEDAILANLQEEWRDAFRK